MLITRLSLHASQRLTEEYKKPVKGIAVVRTVQQLAMNGYVVKDRNETYVVLPNEGVFVIQDTEIVTFIGKSRLTHGVAQRAYTTFSTNKKKAA